MSVRRAPRGDSPRPAYAFLAAVFVAHVVLITAYGHLRPSRMNIRGLDPVAYYSYFHSILFDRDLEFTNQYELLIPERDEPFGKTEIGKRENVFSIGPAIALAPFFLAGHAVALAGDWESDGLSRPYHISGFIGLTFYGGVALFLLGIWSMGHFGTWPGAWAAVLAWGTSPLLYYTSPVTLTPHAIGAAGATLFLIISGSATAPSKKSAVAAGAAMGLAMLARWQNALFILYPFVLSVGRLIVSSDRAASLRREVVYWGLFGVSAIVVFSPQMIAWKIIFGNALLVPQGGGFIKLEQSRILSVLFSPRNGLFTWTPFVAVAMLSFVFAPRGKRITAVVLLFVFGAQTYLNGAVSDWHASFGFSMRRFTELAPIFAFGIGIFLTIRNGKVWFRCAVGIGVLFFIWNEAFVFQYVYRLVAWRGPLTVHEIVGDKFHLYNSFRRRLYIDSAWDHFRIANYEDAVECIRIAKEYDPQHADVFIASGAMFARMTNYERARGDFQRAYELQPAKKDLLKKIKWLDPRIEQRTKTRPEHPFRETGELERLPPTAD